MNVLNRVKLPNRVQRQIEAKRAGVTLTAWDAALLPEAMEAIVVPEAGYRVCDLVSYYWLLDRANGVSRTFGAGNVQAKVDALVCMRLPGVK